MRKVAIYLGYGLEILGAVTGDTYEELDGIPYIIDTTDSQLGRINSLIAAEAVPSTLVVECLDGPELISPDRAKEIAKSAVHVLPKGNLLALSDVLEDRFVYFLCFWNREEFGGRCVLVDKRSGRYAVGELGTAFAKKLAPKI